MHSRMTLVVIALLVLVVGVPISYLLAWDTPRPSTNTEFLLLVCPALLSLAMAGIAVIPGRSRIGSRQGDWLGLVVGVVSLGAVMVGTGIVALTSAI